jgi:hypothetical protein
MRQIDAMYDWPMSAISDIAVSEMTSAFAEGLEGVRADLFVTLAESINGFSSRLLRSKAASDFYADWPSLSDELGKLSTDFEDYRPNEVHKLRVFCVLAAEMSVITDELGDEDLDDEFFEMKALEFDLPVSWLSYENGNDLEGAAFLLNAADLEAISSRLQKKSVTPSLLYYFLQELSRAPVGTSGSFAMVRKTPENIPADAVSAFVRLILLSFGHIVHETVVYSEPLSLVDPNVFRIEHVYQQWGEVIDVVSEYNSHKDLLTKYLVIYHVMENLMFKVPIVKLQREKGGNMFSIRDFQRLYSGIQGSESKALTSLFEILMTADVGAGVTFETRLKNRWNSLAATDSEQEKISKSLSELGVKSKSSAISYTAFSANGSFADRLAKLVYAVRCAVVHNKETELHLTHSTLDAASATIMTKFLIPSLEEICFYFVGKRNNEVWYQSQNLVLYK